MRGYTLRCREPSPGIFCETARKLGVPFTGFPEHENADQMLPVANALNDLCGQAGVNAAGLVLTGTTHTHESVNADPRVIIRRRALPELALHAGHPLRPRLRSHHVAGPTGDDAEIPVLARAAHRLLSDVAITLANQGNDATERSSTEHAIRLTMWFAGKNRKRLFPVLREIPGSHLEEYSSRRCWVG